MGTPLGAFAFLEPFSILPISGAAFRRNRQIYAIRARTSGGGNFRNRFLFRAPDWADSGGEGP